MLQAADVSFAYDDEPVLRGVSLAVPAGDFVGILGPNGSGKTTLLRLLFLSLKPTRGLVNVFGRDRARITRRELPMLRRAASARQMSERETAGRRGHQEEVGMDPVDVTEAHRREERDRDPQRPPGLALARQRASGFHDLIVAYQDGMPVRLSDIGWAEDGIENARVKSWLNGERNIGLGVFRQPGANTVEVVRRVRDLLPEIEREAPPGVKVAVVNDRFAFIKDSIHEVEFHLMLSVILVVLVILAFLRTARPTIITALILPTSVIGTSFHVGSCGDGPLVHPMPMNKASATNPVKSQLEPDPAMREVMVGTVIMPQAET